MMLMQAGQLGLSRRLLYPNSIPPSIVTGATLWIDGTDSSKFFYDWDLAVPATTDGAAIGVAINKVNSGNGMQLNSARPTLKLAAINGYSVIDFAGSTSGQSMDSSVAGGSDNLASNIVTTTSKLLVVGVKVDAAPSAVANPWQNKSIVGEFDGYFGLQVYDPGGGVNLTANAYNYSGGAAQQVSVNFPKAAFVVLTYSHQGGVLRLRVNGGTWATITSGATALIASRLALARNNFAGGVTTDMELAQLAVVNTDQQDDAIAAVEQWIANQLGLSPWW